MSLWLLFCFLAYAMQLTVSCSYLLFPSYVTIGVLRKYLSLKYFLCPRMLSSLSHCMYLLARCFELKVVLPGSKTHRHNVSLLLHLSKYIVLFYHTFVTNLLNITLEQI